MNNIEIGDKVRIKNIPKLLNYAGLELLLENIENFEEIFTIEREEVGWFTLKEDKNYLWFPPALLKKV